MIELEGLSPRALVEVAGGSGRARQVWRSLLAGLDPLEDETLSSALRRRLSERTRLTTLALDHRQVADCGTTKLRFVLADGKRIETVLIPSERRSTICVSTQAGCARGCIFCVTATMGLERSLSIGEIVGQVTSGIREGAKHGRPPVKNVVFMGMGEPLDNLDAVKGSIEILCAPEAAALGPSHITVSTVGPSPDAILETVDLPVRLAWSLHAVDDALRRRLVPTARHSTDELRAAFLERLRRSGGGLFVEMTLIDGVNDEPEHAAALADFLAPFEAPRVNLLPMNLGRAGLAPSSEARTASFRDHIRARGLFCAIRRARGTDRNAACGQLAVV